MTNKKKTCENCKHWKPPHLYEFNKWVGDELSHCYKKENNEPNENPTHKSDTCNEWRPIGE